MVEVGVLQTKLKFTHADLIDHQLGGLIKLYRAWGLSWCLSIFGGGWRVCGRITTYYVTCFENGTIGDFSKFSVLYG